MQNIFEQIYSQARALWIYRWQIVMVTWLTAVIGWASVALLPDKYTATAKIYVDTESMLRPLLKGLAVQTDIDQRIQLMTKALLSRPNLEAIAIKSGLYSSDLAPEQFDRLIGALGKDIKLKFSKQQNLYEISYMHGNPEKARAVVQVLLDIFIETMLGDTRKDTDSAKEFLQNQIEEYERRLREAEDRLTAFRRKYLHILEGGDFFKKLEETRKELRQAELELKEAMLRRNAIRQQLRDFKKASSAASVASGAGMIRTSVDDRLEALRQQLADLSLIYTDEHPEIKTLRNMIAELEAKRMKELEKLAELMEREPEETSANLPPELALSLSEANANVAALRARVDEFRARVGKLEELAKLSPQIETEYKRLNRDYNINKRNYEELVERRESARISENVDKSGDTVKFKVIEPPIVSSIPTWPPRTLLNTAVLVVSIGMGMFVGIVLTQIRPRIHDKVMLGRVSGHPVLASISTIEKDGSIYIQSVNKTGLVMALGGLLAMYSMVLTSGAREKFLELVTMIRMMLKG